MVPKEGNFSCPVLSSRRAQKREALFSSRHQQLTPFNDRRVYDNVLSSPLPVISFMSKFLPALNACLQFCVNGHLLASTTTTFQQISTGSDGRLDVNLGPTVTMIPWSGHCTSDIALIIVIERTFLWIYRFVTSPGWANRAPVWLAHELKHTRTYCASIPVDASDRKKFTANGWETELLCGWSKLLG